MTDSELKPILKEIEFLGDSLDELRSFPEAPKKEAGFQLDMVQRGDLPADWKRMNMVGAGALEIRISDQSGIYRVIYVAKLKDAIYVLHCFQKKTQQTSQKDIDIAKARYETLMNKRSTKK